MWSKLRGENVPSAIDGAVALLTLTGNMTSAVFRLVDPLLGRPDESVGCSSDLWERRSWVDAGRFNHHQPTP